MFDYSDKELAVIDKELETKLAWAEKKSCEAEQLALDATRLLSCTEDRLADYSGSGFFKRCWYKLSDKHGEVTRANQNDLINMQKTAWRYINLLQERDLMMAHSILTVRNNLMTLAVDQEDTKKQITRMADKVYDRFIAVENRMQKVEVSTKIHSWLLTLDTFDYDEKYPPFFRMLRVIGEFYCLKEGEWNIQEIKYLQKAIKEVDLPWKKKLRVDQFVDGLVDEIEARDFEEYYSLLTIGHQNTGLPLPEAFILENISVPNYTALYKIADDYTRSTSTIDILIDQLDIDRNEAIKKVLKTFIAKQGIDLHIAIPLRDLAVELLTCMHLAKNLYQSAIVAQKLAPIDSTATPKGLPASTQASHNEVEKDSDRPNEKELPKRQWRVIPKLN
jgi:hypothetical protein